MDFLRDHDIIDELSEDDFEEQSARNAPTRISRPRRCAALVFFRLAETRPLRICVEYLLNKVLNTE